MAENEGKTNGFKRAPKAVLEGAVEALAAFGSGDGWTAPILAGTYDRDHLERIYVVVMGRVSRDPTAQRAEGWLVALAAWAELVPRFDGLYWKLTAVPAGEGSGR